MKGKILRALRDAGEEYVSGAALCERFGVSRQAVWKNIAALKEAGYAFCAGSRRGYRLLSCPDRLYGPEIESYLSQESFCSRVICLEEVDSTNSYAKKLAEQGEPAGTLVAAERQTAGRGRRGRRWESPGGDSVFMSLLLRPELPPSRVSGITLLAALSLAETVREMTDAAVEIKWPNDVVMGKKKICGILTEMSSEENYVHYAVMGMGINVNREEFPKELRERASSVYLESGVRLNRCEIAARTADLFGRYFRRFESAGDLSPFLEQYNSLLANRDREVKVYYGLAEEASPDVVRVGIARGIDPDGALLVEIEGEKQRIVSGEVSVRGMYGYV